MAELLRNRHLWDWVYLAISALLMVVVVVDLLTSSATATTAVLAVLGSCGLLNLRLTYIEEGLERQ